MNKWLLLFVMMPVLSQAQSVGIGTQTPNASAMLDVSSTQKGLLIPRMTEEQKNIMANPATGLLIWQTDNTPGFYYNGGTPEGPKWYMLSVAADTDWKLAGNNNVDSATHFLGSINKAPVYFKVRNTWAGQLDSGKATFFGYKAGWQAPHRYNTAFGTEALSAPSEEEGNSAFGFMAAKDNRSGDWLTAIGGFSLYSNITGRKNTAVGYQTLPTNVSGNYNTAIGVNALFANDTASQNTAVGAYALQFNKAPHNTALGYSALTKNVSGHRNTAFGSLAMFENSLGFQNTAIGQSSLHFNTHGSNNVAIGRLALQQNTVGSENVAVGNNALQLGINSVASTAVGYSALAKNTAEGNTALGHETLLNNTIGAMNTAIGFHAAYDNTTGNSNIGVGVNALYNNTEGHRNTAVGWQAGITNTTGINNTFIGYFANVNTEARTNATAIGYRAYAECSNCVILGSKAGVHDAASSVNVGIGTTNPGFRLQVGMQGDGSVARANSWTTFSDERYKKDIITIDGALDKIDHINGYYYNWKNGDDKTRQAGLLAQEVEEVLPEIVSTDSEGYKSVDYGKMNALLLQGLKEQNKLIKEMQQEIAELKKDKRK